MNASKIRAPIPRTLTVTVLYKSAHTCNVCRTPHKPIEIHHIDQNPSNNIESNLISLCRNCHDEAHATHKLSRNLDSKTLSDFKQKWELEVASRASTAMLPSSNIEQAMWTYINHQRLPSILKGKSVLFDEQMLSDLVRRKVVNSQGLLSFKLKKCNNEYVTIYDRFEFDDSLKLHHLYMRAVDDLIKKVHPIEMGAIWSKTAIRTLIQPGSICFCMRGFHFKREEPKKGEENRLVYAQAKNIKIQMLANTRHMYGSSALFGNFSGNRFAAILFMAKNIFNDKNILTIEATPLAMGSGFLYYNDQTPHHLQYGWNADREARRMAVTR